MAEILRCFLNKVAVVKSLMVKVSKRHFPLEILIFEFYTVVHF